MWGIRYPLRGWARSLLLSKRYFILKARRHLTRKKNEKDKKQVGNVILRICLQLISFAWAYIFSIVSLTLTLLDASGYIEALELCRRFFFHWVHYTHANYVWRETRQRTLTRIERRNSTWKNKMKHQRKRRNVHKTKGKLFDIGQRLLGVKNWQMFTPAIKLQHLPNWKKRPYSSAGCVCLFYIQETEQFQSCGLCLNCVTPAREDQSHHLQRRSLTVY